MSSPKRSAPLDPAYIAFLEERLPSLQAKKIPWWQRRFRGKRETLDYCLRRVPIDPTGLILEFGVFRGATIRMIARRHRLRRIHGFDSFEGFPDDGRRDWKVDFSNDGRLPRVPANVTLVKGYFDATLPDFVAAHSGESIALLHIDCDIYSSTKTILDHCREMIRPGCLIVFDELLHYNHFLSNEMLAFWEFLEATGLDFEWVATTGNVMPLAQFRDPSDPLRASLKKMADWRRAGYDPSVAVRIVTRR
jgi:hypothetical protein